MTICLHTPAPPPRAELVSHNEASVSRKVSSDYFKKMSRIWEESLIGSGSFGYVRMFTNTVSDIKLYSN